MLPHRWEQTIHRNDALARSLIEHRTDIGEPAGIEEAFQN
jgi:hypothetical protein